MQIYHYNQQLVSLRRQKNLSLKQCAKEIGISSFRLNLFEMGYFRPKGKTLEKIENYYQTKIALEGDKDYPGIIEVEAKKKRKINKKLRLIITDSISLLMIAFMVVGSFLISDSAKSTNNHFGDTYIQLREKAIEGQMMGRDMVTDAEYYYLKSDNSSIAFYKNNSILFFNDCLYTANIYSMDHPEFKTGRFQYLFGDSLGKDSYRCYFSFGSYTTSDFFTCEVVCHSKTEVGKIENLNRKIVGSLDIDEEYAMMLFMIGYEDSIFDFNKLIRSTLGNDELDFFNDFLKDREQGRKINFAMQVSGLVFLFIGVIGFFLCVAIILFTLIYNLKSLLVPFEDDQKDSKKTPLPKDIHIPFGLPDNILMRAIGILKIVSFILLALCALGSAFQPLAFLAKDSVSNIFRTTFIVSTFLGQFVLISSIKKERTLFLQIIRNALFYFTVASLETLVAGTANLWGYNIGEFIYKYVPGAIFQVLALNYLIYLFLFFDPRFLNNKSKKWIIAWRCLSLIPLGILITSIVLSNSYDLVYGVQRDIYIKFWFPDYVITISIVAVLYIYITFFIRLFLKRKYGNKPAHTYFYSDRYMLISNLVYVGLLLTIFLIDIILFENEYAYYLGFRDDFWVLALIPFIFFCKCSPSTIEIMENELDVEEYE